MEEFILSFFSSCLPKSNPAKLSLFLEMYNFTAYFVRTSMDLPCEERPTLRTVVADRMGILSKPLSEKGSSPKGGISNSQIPR